MQAYYILLIWVLPKPFKRWFWLWFIFRGHTKPL